MNINKLTVLLLFLIAISCREVEPVITGIIPQPSEINYQKGSFAIDGETVIIADSSEEGQRVADELRSFLQINFDLTPNISTEEQNNAIHLKLTKEESKRGSYNLTISKTGILIDAGSYQGIFYGVESLKQMLTPHTALKRPILSYVTIKDTPEFQWRGMMLDVSRHFFPKDSVKKVIDILAMHKMNKMHWHLVDGIGWRVQIDKYPELTKRGAWRRVKENKKPWESYESCYEDSEGEVYGGYYTKNDIREIVAYAAERYIDVIPEIEMPGHSEGALQCYPEYSCDGEGTSGVYCAGNDESFTFLQDIISEVVELFPNEYLHIGGDEVGKEAWLQCDKCRDRMEKEDLHDGEELQSYFVKRMEKFIHSKGKKLIGWDEILEGGLPERATVMSWRGVQGGIEAANAGHDVVMSPGSPCYFDHSQGKSEYEPTSWGGYNSLLKVYDFNPVPEDIASDKRDHILGGQANLWTEQIKTLSHVQYMMLPRICALSEALWTNSNKKDKKAFIKKMDHHFDRLSGKGYNFAGSSMSPYYEVSYNRTTKEFSLTLENELNLFDIRYTLDGSTPSIDSELYVAPILYSSSIELNAQCFRDGEAIGFPLKKMFSTGFGDQCKITYSNEYNDTYNGGGDKALFNSKFAIARGDDPNWQGVSEKDFEVLIDLGGEKELSYIGLNFFQDIGATSVMLPTKVTISISKDGEEFTTILDRALETIESRDPIIKLIDTKFEKQDISFIKISATNRGVLPSWHLRKGGAWIFVDEVLIK